MINDSVIFFQHMFTQLIDSIQFPIHPTMFINSPTYTCFELNRGQCGPNRKEFPFRKSAQSQARKMASNGIQWHPILSLPGLTWTFGPPEHPKFSRPASASGPAGPAPRFGRRRHGGRGRGGEEARGRWAGRGVSLATGAAQGGAIQEFSIRIPSETKKHGRNGKAMAKTGDIWRHGDPRDIKIE